MPQKRDPSLIPLSHDHHHGLVRVFEIRQALRRGDPLAEQVTATRRFYDRELRPHFTAEEDAVFPALAPRLEAEERCLARLRDEHRRLAAAVAELAPTPAALGAFADLLERHIRYEEREVFPLYQARVPVEERPAVEAAVRAILDRPADAAPVCRTGS